jgi:hypothetical protein
MGKKDGGTTTFIGRREKNLAAASCQESSLSPHRHKEKEEKLIKPKGEEECNTLS